MGERKVLNKYIPLEFDPAKIPRRRQPRQPMNQQMNVRMMLSMTIRCTTCLFYISRGTKFNGHKEVVVGETYFGATKIFRIYMKCPRCNMEFTFKTDSQDSDYIVDSGATRNVEPWRANSEEIDKEKRKCDAEEMGDAMNSLENRTLDSKREMDIDFVLNELLSLKKRRGSVREDAALETLKHEDEAETLKREDEDERLANFISLQEQQKRIPDDENYEDLISGIVSKWRRTNAIAPEKPTGSWVAPEKPTGSLGTFKDGKFLFKSSAGTVSVMNKLRSEEKKAFSNSGLQSVQHYGSDKEDDQQFRRFKLLRQPVFQAL